MPTDYPGDPTATQAPSVAPAFGAVPTVRLPNDGEAGNVASIWQAIKAGADWIAFLANNSLGNGGYVNLKLAILNGLGGVDDAAGWATTRTGASGYVYLFGAPLLAVPVRVYAAPTGQYVIAYGCSWDVANLRWNRDAGSGTGYAIRLGLDQISFGVGLVAAHWVDGDWTYPLFFDYGIAGGSLAIAKGFTATLGDIVATAGKLKGKRLLGNGSPLVNGDVGSLSGWGAGGAVNAVTGDDMSGTVAITADSSGTSAGPSFKLTFHDGTWGTAPRVICFMSKTGSSTGLAPVQVDPVSATDFTVTVPGWTPDASSTTIFTFVAIGR
jgi:hypothetical protein